MTVQKEENTSSKLELLSMQLYRDKTLTIDSTGTECIYTMCHKQRRSTGPSRYIQ